MEHIRRCVLAIILATLAACGTIQAPEATASAVLPQQTLHQAVQAEPLTPPQEAVKEVSVSDKALASAIATKFKCSMEVALASVRYATMHSYKDFPKRSDILAVIAIESRFNPSARQGGSRGVMQVLVKTHRDKIIGKFDLREQIRVGSLILRESYEDSGRTVRSAMMSYNVGVGAYRRGARPTKYYKKYQEEVAWFKTQERGRNLV